LKKSIILILCNYNILKQITAQHKTKLNDVVTLHDSNLTE